MDDPQLSQDSLSSFMNLPDIEQPVTPEPPHASLPAGTATSTSKMTPPPSTQVPSSQRAKNRTPTPTFSQVSTPPPTIELPSQSHGSRAVGGFTGTLTEGQLAVASNEELRAKVTELQAAYQEAKMASAHHKLQYQMLLQESQATIERVMVEARMEHYENQIIHVAEQAKASATPSGPSPHLEGTIPVDKELYQRMCKEIQLLQQECKYHADESSQREKTILRQDMEIATLTDKNALMRERIRDNLESRTRYRRAYAHMDTPSRSMYNDPLRSGVSSQEQPQPFAALLQASEMASQEARRPSNAKRSHTRNTHSMSSLPTTPSRKQTSMYHTPQGRQQHLQPSTAPLPRTSNMRNPDVYTHPSLPVPHTQGPPSDGTVSMHEDDSEAETEIIEQDEISESQASRAASQMLRSSQEQQAKRDSFQGSGMLAPSAGGEKLKQTKLFGQVRKGNVQRERDGEDGRPAKRARTGQVVGLGIS